MNYKLFLAACLLVFSLGSLAQTEVPIPTQAQLQWQNAELVAVFHYDLHVFDDKKYIQPTSG